MRNTWEKVCDYVGTEYGNDIATELINKVEMTIPQPTYPQAVLTRHTARENVIQTGRQNLLAAKQQQLTTLQTQALQADAPAELPVTIASLQNEMAQLTFELQEPVEVQMTKEEESLYGNEWRTYRERRQRLIKNRGQAYHLIIGQCTQLLKDKFEQDADWTTVKTAQDPIQLYRLIEKTVLAQTEDQYPCATVFDQETSLYVSRQETMSNAKWYEVFNTRADVAIAVGVTREHKAILDFSAQETYNQDFESLTDTEKDVVREDAKEQYLAYCMLRMSGK